MKTYKLAVTEECLVNYLKENYDLNQSGYIELVKFVCWNGEPQETWGLIGYEFYEGYVDFFVVEPTAPSSNLKLASPEFFYEELEVLVDKLVHKKMLLAVGKE